MKSKRFRGWGHWEQLWLGKSSILVVLTPLEIFRRGDTNADGATNLADAVATFNFLFLGGDEPACLDAADSNDVDNALNLTDGVFLLNFLFLGGDPPPEPGAIDCGTEPAASPITFGCDSSPCP